MSSIGNDSGAEQLAGGLQYLGIVLTNSQLDSILWLSAELRNWNARVNLTGVTDLNEILIKHVLDSLTLVPLVDQLSAGRPLTIVDVGSGAGFPGLPLKLARPRLRVTLVEATAKKITFINHVVQDLALEGTEAVGERAETLARAPSRRESFDIAVARAVGSTPAVAELLTPLVNVGGRAVLMKTRAGLEEEAAAGTPAWDELGYRPPETLDVGIPGLLDDRVLLVAEKMQPASVRFPRRPGVAQRRPLLQPLNAGAGKP